MGKKRIPPGRKRSLEQRSLVRKRNLNLRLENAAVLRDGEI